MGNCLARNNNIYTNLLGKQNNLKFYLTKGYSDEKIRNKNNITNQSIIEKYKDTHDYDRIKNCYYFIIYDSVIGIILAKILLSYKKKPNIIYYDYTNNNILYLTYELKFNKYNDILYEDISYTVKVYNNGTYKILKSEINYDCDNYDY
jgi:hypothetical protein